MFNLKTLKDEESIKIEFEYKGRSISFDIPYEVFKKTEYRIETYKEIIPVRIVKNCEQFGLDVEVWIKAALKQPPLFVQLSETLNGNVEGTSKLLRVEKREFIKAALKRPQLFVQLPETINGNVERSIELLGIEKKEFVRAALKQPSLFYQLPETISGNVERTSKLLGIEKKDFIKASLKQPPLFVQLSETLNGNVEGTSKLLRVEKREFIKAALKRPQLFFQLPETINGNVEKTSKLLCVDKEEFIGAALKQPPLFVLLPETIFENFKTIILLFNSQNEALKYVLKNPVVLTLSQERNLTHLFVRQLTEKMTDIYKNPIRYLENYHKTNPQKLSLVGLEQLKRIFIIFDQNGKKRRKERRSKDELGEEIA